MTAPTITHEAATPDDRSGVTEEQLEKTLWPTATVLKTGRDIQNKQTVTKLRVPGGVPGSLSGGVAYEPAQVEQPDAALAELLVDQWSSDYEWLYCDPSRWLVPFYEMVPARFRTLTIRPISELGEHIEQWGEEFARVVPPLQGTVEESEIPLEDVLAECDWEGVLEGEGFPSDVELANFGVPLRDRAVVYSSARLEYAEVALLGLNRRSIGDGPGEEETTESLPPAEDYRFSKGADDWGRDAFGYSLRPGAEAKDSSGEAPEPDATEEAEPEQQVAWKKEPNEPRSKRLTESFKRLACPSKDRYVTAQWSPDLDRELIILPGWLHTPRAGGAHSMGEWIDPTRIPRVTTDPDQSEFVLLTADPTTAAPVTIFDGPDYAADNLWFSDALHVRLDVCKKWLKDIPGEPGAPRVRSERWGGSAMLAPRADDPPSFRYLGLVKPQYREADAIEALLGERLDTGELHVILVLRAALGMSWEEIEQWSSKMTPTDWRNADRDVLENVAKNLESLVAQGYSGIGLDKYKVVHGKSYSPGSRLDALRKKLLGIQEEMRVEIPPVTKPLEPRAEKAPLGYSPREWVAYSDPGWFEQSRLPGHYQEHEYRPHHTFDEKLIAILRAGRVSTLRVHAHEYRPISLMVDHLTKKSLVRLVKQGMVSGSCPIIDPDPAPIVDHGRSLVTLPKVNSAHTLPVDSYRAIPGTFRTGQEAPYPMPGHHWLGGSGRGLLARIVMQIAQIECALELAA